MGSAYRLFCLVVFAIQFVVAVLSYVIAYDRTRINRRMIDILVGISWTITSLWWLFCGVTLTGL